MTHFCDQLHVLTKGEDCELLMPMRVSTIGRLLDGTLRSEQKELILQQVVRLLLETGMDGD